MQLLEMCAPKKMSLNQSLLTFLSFQSFLSCFHQGLDFVMKSVQGNRLQCKLGWDFQYSLKFRGSDHKLLTRQESWCLLQSAKNLSSYELLIAV